MERWTPTDEEYYACKDWLSHSEWKSFIRSPKLYERQVFHGLGFKKNSSMDFGNEVDAAVFHPEGVAAGVAIATKDVLSPAGRKVGKKFKEFVEANPGKTIVKHDEPLARVLWALGEHAEAMGVLDAPGQAQAVFRWESEIEGETLKRRAKLDKLPHDLSFIADLKTTKDPSAESFSRDIVSYGYHTQAVWYQDAVEAYHGVRPPFLIVAVQNCEPYDCEVYELNEAFLELGRRKIDAGLKEFVECRRANKWRKNTHGTIVKLAPPYWAERALTDWNFQGGVV